MNDARKRRPLIRERARIAGIQRREKETVQWLMTKCPHGENEPLCLKCNPIPPYPKTVLLAIRMYDLSEDLWYIDVRVPMKNLDATVRKMFSEGFWAQRPRRDGVTFFPPKSIRHVSIMGEDNRHLLWENGHGKLMIDEEGVI